MDMKKEIKLCWQGKVKTSWILYRYIKSKREARARIFPLISAVCGGTRDGEDVK